MNKILAFIDLNGRVLTPDKNFDLYSYDEMVEDSGYNSSVCIEKGFEPLISTQGMYKIINELKKVEGALSYDGEASVQVLLPTKNKEYLRIGVTDNDVAARHGIWFDYYEGFNNEIKNIKHK